MANDFDYLHIKGHTEGSSNELSLDVLDAARSNLDNKGKRRNARRGAALPGFSRIPRPARSARSANGASAAHSRPAKGPRKTSHGASGDSALASVPEVARRKRERRSSALRKWAVGVLVFALVVGAGTFFGYRFYQQRVDFNGRFIQLVDEVVEVDQTLVDVDIAMKDPLTSAAAGGVSDTMQEIPQMREQLDQVVAEAQGMMEERGDDDVAALNEVVDAAQARMDLLDPAEDALKLAAQVNDKVAQANAAWNKVLDADQCARNAAAMANSASTVAETTAARDKTSEAIEQMNSALAAMKELESSNQGLDLSAQKSYLQKRAAALGYAVQTSDALLANDRQAATAANNSYNAGEREAASLASNLPISLGDEVEELYSDQLNVSAQRYREARVRVTEVDSTLRARIA